MLAVLRELTDRFIEFILKNVKGDSEEAKLVAALKTLALTITVLIWMVVGLLFSNINLRIDFNDLNLGMERMSVIFSATDENPFYKFLKVNDALSARNERLVKDNSSLLKQNVRLTQQNVYLSNYTAATTAMRQIVELQNLTYLGTATYRMEQYQILHQ